jgi:hypothetical protein
MPSHTSDMKMSKSVWECRLNFGGTLLQKLNIQDETDREKVLRRKSEKNHENGVKRA